MRSVAGAAAHQGEAVADGEHDALDAVVPREGFVEGADGLRVGRLVFVVEDTSGPEDVVEGDEATIGELRQDGFVVGGVVGLVGIDEDEAEGAIEGGDGVERGGEAQLDAVAVGAAVEVLLGDAGMLPADLAGVEAAPRRAAPPPWRGRSSR